MNIAKYVYMVLLLTFCLGCKNIAQTIYTKRNNFNFEKGKDNFSYQDSNCVIEFRDNAIASFANFDSSVIYKNVKDTSFLEIITYSPVLSTGSKKLKIILFEEEILFDVGDTTYALEDILLSLKEQGFLESSAAHIYEPIPNFPIRTVRMSFSKTNGTLSFEFLSRHGFSVLGIDRELNRKRNYTWGFYNGIATVTKKFEFLVNNHYETNKPILLQFIDIAKLEGYYFLDFENDGKGFKKIYEFSNPLRNNVGRIDDSKLFFNLDKRNYKGYSMYEVLKWQRSTTEFYKNHDLDYRTLGIIVH